MPITFGGFATGLDTNAIISAFVKAERIPVDRMLKEQSDVQAASQTISAVSTKLSALRDAAGALADPTRFAAMAVTSSDTALVASTTIGASPGRYEVTVTQVAKEQRTYGDVQASGTDALSMTGNLSIQVGAGAAVDVAIDPGDSLSAIAAKINSSGARVAANVIYDGTNYRLGVRGLDTGAANAVSFTETGTALGMATPANTVQAAQDASLLVDGIPITRPTNQVTGVIQGVTLALTKPTTTPATIEVASDAAKLKDKITTFINAYNDVVKASQSAAGYGGQKASNAVLSGDSTLRGVVERIARTVGSKVTGTTGAYDTLMSVGISSTKDGQLRFDEAKLATALSKDSTAVAKLFTKDATLGSTGAFETLRVAVDALNGTATSPVRARIDSLQRQASRMNDSVDAMQRRIDSYEAMLRKQFSTLEATVSRFQSAGSAAGAGSSGSGSQGG